MRVLKASHAPLAFEIVDNIIDEVRAHTGILSHPACCAAAPHAPSIHPLLPPSPQLTPEALSSCRRTGCILKGEFNTGIGKGTKPSINVELRKSLALFANVVHPFNIPGIASRHDNLDIVIVRENMEGEFSGMEHEVVPGVAESLKVMTRDATRRIAQYAFEYAFLNNRSKVTAVHKANIMKKVRVGESWSGSRLWRRHVRVPRLTQRLHPPHPSTHSTRPTASSLSPARRFPSSTRRWSTRRSSWTTA